MPRSRTTGNRDFMIDLDRAHLVDYYYTNYISEQPTIKSLEGVKIWKFIIGFLAIYTSNPTKLMMLNSKMILRFQYLLKLISYQ